MKNIKYILVVMLVHLAFTGTILANEGCPCENGNPASENMECCGDVEYNPDTHCCVDGEVVQHGTIFMEPCEPEAPGGGYYQGPNLSIDDQWTTAYNYGHSHHSCNFKNHSVVGDLHTTVLQKKFTEVGSRTSSGCGKGIDSISLQTNGFSMGLSVSKWGITFSFTYQVSGIIYNLYGTQDVSHAYQYGKHYKEERRINSGRFTGTYSHKPNCDENWTTENANNEFVSFNSNYEHYGYTYRTCSVPCCDTTET